MKVKDEMETLAKLYKCAKYAPASHQMSYTQDQLTKFTLSELPTINEAIALIVDGNHDFILVDVDCEVVNGWIRDVVKYCI